MNLNQDEWNKKIKDVLSKDFRTKNLDAEATEKLAYNSGLLKTESNTEEDVLENYTQYRHKWFNDRHESSDINLNEDNIFNVGYVAKVKSNNASDIINIDNSALSPKSQFKGLSPKGLLNRDYNDRINGIRNTINEEIENFKFGEIRNETGATIRAKLEKGDNKYVDFPNKQSLPVNLDGVIVGDTILKVNPFIDGVVRLDKKTGKPYLDYEDNIIDVFFDSGFNIGKMGYNIGRDIGIVDGEEKEYSGTYEYNSFTKKHKGWIDPLRDKKIK